MEHTKAYQEFKKNGNTKFQLYTVLEGIGLSSWLEQQVLHIK